MTEPFKYEIEFPDDDDNAPDFRRELTFLGVRSLWTFDDGTSDVLKAACDPAVPFDESQLASQLFALAKSTSTSDFERRTYNVNALLAYIKAERALAEGRTDAAWNQFAQGRYWEGKSDGDYDAWIANDLKRKAGKARAKSQSDKVARLKSEVVRNLRRTAPANGWKSENQAMKAITPSLLDFIDRENTPWLREYLDEHLHVWIYEDVEVLEALASGRSIPG